MPATSKHWGDIAKWIESSIETSTCREHRDSNFNLINSLMDTMLKEGIDYETTMTVRRNLLSKLNSHFTTHM
jgi:hypothetical protein